MNAMEQALEAIDDLIFTALREVSEEDLGADWERYERECSEKSREVDGLVTALPPETPYRAMFVDVARWGRRWRWNEGLDKLISERNKLVERLDYEAEFKTPSSQRGQREIPTDLLTVAEVARYLSMSDDQVRSLIASKKLVALDLSQSGGRATWRVRKADLDAYINGSPASATATPTRRKNRQQADNGQVKKFF